MLTDFVFASCEKDSSTSNNRLTLNKQLFNNRVVYKLPELIDKIPSKIGGRLVIISKQYGYEVGATGTGVRSNVLLFPVGSKLSRRWFHHEVNNDEVGFSCHTSSGLFDRIMSKVKLINVGMAKVSW